MEEMIRQLLERKSVRVFEDRSIEPEKEELILRAALEAPSAGNMTLYSILKITDPALRQRLAETCDGQLMIARAPLVLIFAADYSKWYKSFCLWSKNQPRKPQASDFIVATTDACIAAQNAVTAAWALGIGSCYIGDIREHYEEHQKLLNLPDYAVPACMICFGYPTQQQKDRVKPARFVLEDVVFENQYPKMGEAELKAMFQKRERAMGRENTSVEDMVDAMMERKWNSPYSRERIRSVAASLEPWREE